VAVASSIPLHAGEDRSPLEDTLHALQPWVAFGVLPVFVFANAGVSLQGVGIQVLTQSVPLGIAAGLVLGKALGVFGVSWLLAVTGAVELPAGANRWQLFGACMLCGVGLGMGLFAGGIAFDGEAASYASQAKLGVLCGSLVAALLGTAILLRAERRGPSRRRQQHLPSQFQ
jgi:NhaA family Na+:H+ antiporter